MPLQRHTNSAPKRSLPGFVWGPCVSGAVFFIFGFSFVPRLGRAERAGGSGLFIRVQQLGAGDGRFAKFGAHGVRRTVKLFLFDAPGRVGKQIQLLIIVGAGALGRHPHQPHRALRPGLAQQRPRRVVQRIG